MMLKADPVRPDRPTLKYLDHGKRALSQRSRRALERGRCPPTFSGQSIPSRRSLPNSFDQIAANEEPSAKMPASLISLDHK
jgi:hypothetical protein